MEEYVYLFYFYKNICHLYYIIVWKATHKTKMSISEQWNEGEVFHFHFLQFLLCTLLEFFFFSGMSGDCQSSLWPCGSLVPHVCLSEANSLFYNLALDSQPSSPTVTLADSTFLWSLDKHIWRLSHCPSWHISTQHKGA